MAPIGFSVCVVVYSSTCYLNMNLCVLFFRGATEFLTNIVKKSNIHVAAKWMPSYHEKASFSVGLYLYIFLMQQHFYYLQQVRLIRPLKSWRPFWHQGLRVLRKSPRRYKCNGNFLLCRSANHKNEKKKTRLKLDCV